MLKGHHDKDDHHHFTRETGQHYSIEISSCYNLRFEKLEDTSEIFCPSLLLSMRNWRLEPRAGEVTGPRSCRSPGAATQ